MGFGPQRPGAVLEDERAPGASVHEPEEPMVDYDTHHLCLKCVHASTCAVAASVRLLGAEGQIVISKCAAFFELPKEPASSEPPAPSRVTPSRS